MAGYRTGTVRLPSPIMGLIVQSFALFLSLDSRHRLVLFLCNNLHGHLRCGSGTVCVTQHECCHGNSCSQPPGNCFRRIRTTAWNVGYTISLNLAIVLMSFTLPYQTVSTLIASNITTISAANRELFVESLKSTYFWLAVINTTAIVPSLFGSKLFRAKPAPRL